LKIATRPSARYKTITKKAGRRKCNRFVVRLSLSQNFQKNFRRTAWTKHILAIRVTRILGGACEIAAPHRHGFLEIITKDLISVQTQ